MMDGQSELEELEKAGVFKNPIQAKISYRHLLVKTIIYLLKMLC